MCIIFTVGAIIEMLLSLKTAFCSKGLIIVGQREVFFNYLGNQFTYDFLALVPLVFSFFVHEHSSNNLIVISYLLEFLVFAKWCSLNRLIARLERIFTQRDTFAPYWMILKLFFNIFLVAHILALIYNVSNF
jgi:hypothetical protein